ncbi:TAF6-like RNA polymerase II p300/CBP-associated factor-associated factor 65 kDa subunit 6L [Bacillus rossius redtenbacheri]|uniref:TAF6-like RNA polymerase II p300/CBP-associated factor-associated factor 65 kDa subunit 6L n=1 Tax=Bacillus rossius redtenbacheri TaxID=93214 RepID=UPI002FDE15E1
MAAAARKSDVSKHGKDQVRRKRDDKKPAESSKYYVISSESVAITGESIGISELNSDVTKALSEDVSYRLREVIFNCNVLLRQCKSKKLTTDVVDAVFNTCGVPPVYGHSAVEPLGFNNTVLPNLLVLDDAEIDLPLFASSVEQYVQPPDISLHGEWVHPDSGGSEGLAASPPAVKKEEPAAGGEKAARKEDAPASSSEKPAAGSMHVPSFLVTYFRHFAKVILSESDRLLQVVLEDLRRNVKLGLVVPCFLNLVAFSLQKLPRGTPVCLRLLSIVEAITCNKHIQPEGSISVSRLISVLLLCAVNVQSQNLDDFTFRRKAGHMLAKVVSAWCRSETKLYLDILQKLGMVLTSGGSSLRSHYGALVTLYALGPDALDQCLWPHLGKYLAVLEPQVKTATWETLQVQRALLMAAELFCYQEWRRHGGAGRGALHQLLSEHFGDVLCVAQAHGRPRKESGESRAPATPPASSLAKQPATNAFELDYLHWTAIAPMPSGLAALLRAGGPCVTPRRRRPSTARRLTADAAFDPPPPRLGRERRAIGFSFAGCGPVPPRELRRRGPGPSQARFERPSAYHECSRRLRCVGQLAGRPRGRLASVRVPHILDVI